MFPGVSSNGVGILILGEFVEPGLLSNPLVPSKFVGVLPLVVSAATRATREARYPRSGAATRATTAWSAHRSAGRRDVLEQAQQPQQGRRGLHTEAQGIKMCSIRCGNQGEDGVDWSEDVVDCTPRSGNQGTTARDGPSAASLAVAAFFGRGRSWLAVIFERESWDHVWLG